MVESVAAEVSSLGGRDLDGGALGLPSRPIWEALPVSAVSNLRSLTLPVSQ